MTQTVVPEAELSALLSNCVLKVTTPSDQGSGFVIRRNIVLTCRHVVEGVDVGGAVTVVDIRGRSYEASVVAKFPPETAATLEGVYRWPDLALLRVDDGQDLPAVLMDTREIDPTTRLLVGGYPAKAAVGYQTRDYVAGSSMNVEPTSGHRYLMLSGESIDAGQSGAPVLSPAGLVCGYVRFTRASSTTLGGLAVPLSEVVPMIPDLLDAYHDPGSAAQQWLDVLPALMLKEYGRDMSGVRFDAAERPPAMVDIELSRAESAGSSTVMSEWDVCITSEPPRVEHVRTADLGDGVLDAVNHWSRRHRLVTKSQVDLLGKVLCRGFLPPPIVQAIGDVDTREPALVRLRTDEDDALAVVPWEYADGLATTPNWTFTRYVKGPKLHLPRADSARALVVVNGSHEAEADELARTLDESMTALCKRIDFRVVHSQTFADFTAELHDAPWDIVHYVGIGWADSGLGFDRGGWVRGEQKLARVEWATVNESLSSTGVKAVILQLGAQRSDLSPSLAGFLDLLTRDNQVRALVLAEHATTVDHVMMFSSSFYKGIDGGGSVERSVQEARRSLYDAPPATSSRQDELDHAAFGTVSVITTEEGNIKLLTRDPTSGGAPAAGAKSAQPGADSFRSVDRSGGPGPAGQTWGANPNAGTKAGFDR